MTSLNYNIKPISLRNIKINDSFWTPRIKTNQEITIPYVLQQCEESGRIDNFSRAAGLLNDGKIPINPYDDSDVYKIIEGAAYSLMIEPDSQLEQYIDNLIDKIAAAQENDGYIYTSRTITPDNPHEWSGKERWELVSFLSHELYNIGHLIEGAIAYYQATDKRKLFDVAIKAANLIDNTFGPGKLEKEPGHQEIEIALIKLFQETKIERYLTLAKFFLDIRGTKNVEGKEYEIKEISAYPPQQSKGLLQYNQSHKKVINQVEAVGHAVRAMYMYSAMTDISILTGKKEYLMAIENIWNDIVFKKLYITGGIGSTKIGEAFESGYKLPNKSAYNETCAAIGYIFWNYRLFLLYGESKYLDVLERTLYNGFLSGISLKGTSFFYPNPLASKGDLIRSSWFECACCPSNIVRLIPQIPSFIYATKGNIIFVNLFIGNTANILLEDTEVSLVQETIYPWEGNIKIIVKLLKKKEFCIAIRIPGWAQNKPVPSNLYYYLKPINLETIIKINEEILDYQTENGFVKIHRMWKNNDAIELIIPMPIRRILSHEKVKANKNKVAIERGPIVYCIESVDHNVESVFNFTLNDNSVLEQKYCSELLNGVVAITGLINDKNEKIEKLLAIPYYAWAHRGASKMIVWLQRDSSNAN